VRVTPSGPVKANRGVRARVPAAWKVLEGDDQPTLSALYYDVFCIALTLMVVCHARRVVCSSSLRTQANSNQLKKSRPVKRKTNKISS